MELINLPNKILNEIFLMALTYRVSFKNLAKIFNTTEEELKATIEKFEKYNPALYHLNKETKIEDEINERYAYIHAHNYWTNRNKLLKEYKNFKNNPQQSAIILANIKEPSV